MSDERWIAALMIGYMAVLFWGLVVVMVLVKR